MPFPSEEVPGGEKRGGGSNASPAKGLLSRLIGLEASDCWAGSDGGASVSDRVLAGPTLAQRPLIPRRAGVLHGSLGWFEGYAQLPGRISSIFGGLKVARKDKGVTYQ